MAKTGPVEACCPYCGEKSRKRAGVAMSPFMCALFDAIGHTADGSTVERLIAKFYQGVPRADAMRRVYANVHKLNEMLVSTDLRAVNVGNRSDARYVIKNFGDQGPRCELRTRPARPPALADR